jgi:hypothetical protein
MTNSAKIKPKVCRRAQHTAAGRQTLVGKRWSANAGRQTLVGKRWSARRKFLTVWLTVSGDFELQKPSIHAGFKA